MCRDEELEFAPLPFDHPLWVLYSSGTTGLPKPIVHGQGGILLEQLKKVYLHLDAQPGDRLFWFTTTGWMMWNFLVGVLLSDASIVLFDGNPGYPSLGRLWDLAADTGMTTLRHERGVHRRVHEGRGPHAPRGSRSQPLYVPSARPGRRLSPEGFQWIYDQLGSDTWLFSTSGGTDLCTAFVGGVPTLPVYLGELQARSLGASVEAWDPEGRPLIDEVGELVITRADAFDAGLLLGRLRRVAVRGELLLDVPGDLAPRRLDRDHRRAGPRSSTAARTRRSTAAGPDGHQRDLPGRAGARRDRRRAGRRRAARRDRRLDAAVRRSPRGRIAGRRRWTRDPRRGSARTARRATSRTRSRRSPRCPGRCRARCSRSPSNESSWGPHPSRPPPEKAWLTRRRWISSSTSGEKREGPRLLGVWSK